MTAPGIDIDQPRTGRPSQHRVELYRRFAIEQRAELRTRAEEEAQMAEAIAPLINRLRLMAEGPVARATVAEMERLAARHARRWAPQSPEAA